MSREAPEKSLADYAREAAQHSMGQAGFACPACGCRHFDTTSTYAVLGGLARRRVCRNCHRPARSLEILSPGQQTPPLG